ncbi:hypothetical protein BT69DRAFT_779629 [Atractiella rhizophila]|nr:hypothetical protein BT69DRAFT_779629 [Atractiella rhizophila]
MATSNKRMRIEAGDATDENSRITAMGGDRGGGAVDGELEGTEFVEDENTSEEKELSVVNQKGLMDLSEELLVMIFTNLDYKGCKGWTLSCKRLGRIAAEPYNLSQYFLLNFGKREALYHAIWQGKVVNTKVIDILLKCGAIFSRYLVQTLAQTYMRGAVPYVRPGWGKSANVPAKLFSHILGIATDRWPEPGSLDLDKNRDDGTLFTRWFEERKRLQASQANNTGSNRQALKLQEEQSKKEWAKIKVLFETYNFVPFSGKDSLLTELPKAVAFEPELLNLAQKNGFTLDTRLQDFVIRSAFSKIPTNGQNAHLTILDSIRAYLKLDIGFYISVDVASEILREAEDSPSAYQALKSLKKEELLFDLADVARCVILSLDRQNMLADYPTLPRVLYKDFGAKFKDPKVDSIILATFFGPPIDEDINGPNNQFRRPKAINDQVKKMGIKVTEDIVVDCICNPWTFGVEKIMTWCGRFHSFDVYDIVNKAARKMVRMPFKGATLMLLVNKYPCLKKVVEEELLLHEIDMESLKESSACHKCRFFCRHSVDIYSPIAINARPTCENFASMEEVAYVGGISFENYMVPEDLSKKVWKDKEGVKNVGSISYKRMSESLEEYEHPERSRRLSYWSSLRYSNTARPRLSDSKRQIVAEGVPTAIPYLDWFPRNSRCLQIVLIHAGINLNRDIVLSYLAEGVPLTLRFFEYMSKVGYIDAKVFDLVCYGRPFYRDESEVPAPSPLKNVKRKSKLKKAERATSALISQLPTINAEISASGASFSTDSGPQKRPRRSVARKNYADQEIEIEDDFVEEEEPEINNNADLKDEDFEDSAERKKRLQKAKGKAKEREAMDPDMIKWLDAFMYLAKLETARVSEKRIEKSKGLTSRLRIKKTDFHRASIALPCSFLGTRCANDVM